MTVDGPYKSLFHQQPKCQRHSRGDGQSPLATRPLSEQLRSPPTPAGPGISQSHSFNLDLVSGLSR